jgi:site-specific recombinase XerD
MVGIHNYEQRFNRTLERIKSSQEISEGNKAIILRFKDYLLSEGIGIAKIERYFGDLMKFNRLLGKGFEKANKDDIRRVVSAIHQEPLSEETKRCFKIMLRKFYRMIRGVEEKGIYPDEVRWMSLELGVKHRKLPEELLNEEEIKLIIQSCKNNRDKALIACLAESGCRISEIGLLRVKHISFESHGARISVNGKTGARKVLIINSVPYLQEWINSHPDNSNPDAFIWCTTKSRLLTYHRMTAILKTAAKQAGIRKRVHPHLFRHSRATKLAGIMSDSQLKNYLGWTQGSKMAGIYVHMNGKETDEAIYKENGIDIQEEKKEPYLKPISCNRCRGINPATNRFCNKCGFILDNQTAREILQQESEQKGAVICLDKLLQDPEVKKILMKKLNLMQIEKP